MSTESPTPEPGRSTARPRPRRRWSAFAGEWIGRGIAYLTWLAVAVTWAVWILGDRSEPAPPWGRSRRS